MSTAVADVPQPARTYDYDAFCSYATRTDYHLVRRVESFLESFHKLSTPQSGLLRPLRVCVDGSDFRLESNANRKAEIERVLTDHLSRSRFLLLFASKASAESPYVAFEVDWYLKHRDSADILVALTEGDDPAAHPEQAFSATMVAAGLHQKVWYDLRGARRRNRRATRCVRDLDDERIRLASHLNDRTPGEVRPLWFREQLRRRAWWLAAIAALIVVGTVLMVRIYVERNRAERAAALAETQRTEAARRAEELTLSQARYDIDVNPTRAVLMVKPLATKYWREVRTIAAAAHAAGVAWSLPAARETLSLEMSHDGTRALSAGRDGVVRVYDLVRRTTRPVLELGAPALARFGDGDRQIAAWHDRQLVIANPATGQRRDVAAPRPIADLKVVGTTAYWVDGTSSLWQLDLAGSTPLALPIDEPVGQLAPSPDGRWIALAGEHHLYLVDRSRPHAAAQGMMRGATHEMVWSSTGAFLDALIDESVISYQMTPAPELVDRRMVGPRLSLARQGATVYILGPTGVVIIDLNGSYRRSISGSPVGLAEARGGTMIAGASDGITVISEDGDHALPLPAARVERVVASPRSPYLLAQVEGRLLLWNLDDIQPRRLSDNPTGHALFADPDHVIAGGTLDLATQAIDLTTRTATPLGEWQDLRGVTSAGPGRALAVVDGEHHVHLVVPGQPAQDLPGEIDIAAFATNTQLVLTTIDGQLLVHDVATGRRAPLVERASPLLGLAWGRGHHPWVAAAFSDGALWRKNLATGATATATRVPAIDPRRVAPRDGKLLIAADGGVVFLHDGEVHRWDADGAFGLLARAAKPLEEFGEAGPDHIIAIAADTTIYRIDLTPDGRAAGAIREALDSIASSSAAMAPDTGMLVAIEHGALTILDPLARQRWTLAPPSGATFTAPAISADGRRVIASTPRSLLAWSIDLPDSAEATVRWLDAMTNAVDDRTPGSLGWR